MKTFWASSDIFSFFPEFFMGFNDSSWLDILKISGKTSEFCAAWLLRNAFAMGLIKSPHKIYQYF